MSLRFSNTGFIVLFPASETIPSHLLLSQSSPLHLIHILPFLPHTNFTLLFHYPLSFHQQQTQIKNSSTTRLSPVRNGSHIYISGDCPGRRRCGSQQIIIIPEEPKNQVHQRPQLIWWAQGKQQCDLIRASGLHRAVICKHRELIEEAIARQERRRPHFHLQCHR